MEYGVRNMEYGVRNVQTDKKSTVLLFAAKGNITRYFPEPVICKESLLYKINALILQRVTKVTHYY